VRAIGERKQEGGSSSKTGVGFRDSLLVVIAALCSFGGPYLVYALTSHVFKLDWFVSIAAGFALLAVGLALIGILIKRKAIS
jgi:hypothetical protein